MSIRILALDTATEACSVALYNNGEITADFAVTPREHTQRILPMVQAVLAQQNLSLRDLDALAFGQGPGSFTGVRIGVGIAQGLALGAELPMIGVSSLETMAEGVFRTTGLARVLVAIDARMDEVYCAAYVRDEQGIFRQELAEAVLKPADFVTRCAALTGEWRLAGTGWAAYPQMQETLTLSTQMTEITLPHAQDMLPPALNALRHGETSVPESAEPVYLRNEVTWKKLPGRG
ncbi:tRNA (adenosine(37)-N6)-threonylcarbamoyltransferase complex dimerization subunit type 1 TsaB [Morganella morganii]